MLEPLSIDTTHQDYIAIWIKNNNKKRKLRHKDIKIVTDSLYSEFGLLACDVSSVLAYNKPSSDVLIKDKFVVKIPRTFLNDLKVYETWGKYDIMGIYHPEDRENRIALNRFLNKFMVQDYIMK